MSVYLFNCNCDGHTNTTSKERPHYFIIITPKRYNDRSTAFLSISISSQSKNPFVNEYGIVLTKDDFPTFSLPTTANLIASSEGKCWGTFCK